MRSKLLEPVWKGVKRGWNNKLHTMCSYLAMFPPALPSYFIRQFTKEGDIVLDPFSGRGTTLLEASLLGRVPIGNDLNPLAVVLSRAKVNVPNYQKIITRIRNLEKEYEIVSVDNEPEDIKMLFDINSTLPQLVYLKSKLNLKNSIDNFIIAVLAGIMHGKTMLNGTSNFLSISMPNTFSMSPNYIKKYINEKKLVPPKQDVFKTLINRIDKIYPFENQLRKGKCYKGNALILPDKKSTLLENKVKLIVTSPPYLKVINYGQYNWIRLWLLNSDSVKVDESLRMDRAYENGKNLKLSDNLRMDQYLKFMQELICGWERVLTDDGLAVIVIGDVDNHNGSYINLADEVWNHVKNHTTLKKVSIIEDNIEGNKKVTRIWGQQRKGNATKMDRILLLSKSGNLPEARIKRNIKKRFLNGYKGDANNELP